MVTLEACRASSRDKWFCIRIVRGLGRDGHFGVISGCCIYVRFRSRWGLFVCLPCSGTGAEAEAGDTTKASASLALERCLRAPAPARSVGAPASQSPGPWMRKCSPLRRQFRSLIPILQHSWPYSPSTFHVESISTRNRAVRYTWSYSTPASSLPAPPHPTLQFTAYSLRLSSNTISSV